MGLGSWGLLPLLASGPYWLNVTVSDGSLVEPGAAVWNVSTAGLGTAPLHSSWAAVESAGWQRLCPPECSTESGSRSVWRYRDAFVERLDCTSEGGLVVFRPGLSLPVTGCDFKVKTEGGLFVPWGGSVEVPCTVEFSFRAGGPESAALELPTVQAVGQSKPIKASCLVGVYEAEGRF